MICDLLSILPPNTPLICHAPRNVLDYVCTIYTLTDSEGGAGAGLLADGNAVPGDGGVWLGEEALLHALPRTLAIAQHLHTGLLLVL